MDASPYRFDWYQASVQVGWLALKDHLRAEIPGCKFEPCKSIGMGYTDARQVLSDDEKICRVLLGPGRDPHILTTGAISHPVALHVVRPLPHTVSRTDVCLDYDQGPDTWNLIQNIVQPIAVEAGIVREVAGADPEGPPQPGRGQTKYFGSTKSRVRMRIYEKGTEVLAKGGQASPSLVRVEVQLRPIGRRQKQAVSQMTLEEIAGVSPWTKRICDTLQMSNIPRGVLPVSPALGVEESALRALKVYGRVLRAMRSRLGGPGPFGEWVNRAID